MKEPQSSFLERGTELRASPHLCSASTRTHKQQFPSSLPSSSYPKSLYIFMGAIHWRQSSWVPFIGTSHPKAAAQPGLCPPVDREQIPWAHLHCRHPDFSQLKPPSCLICAALLSGTGRLSPVWHCLRLLNKWCGFSRLQKPERNFLVPKIFQYLSPLQNFLS